MEDKYSKSVCIWKYDTLYKSLNEIKNINGSDCVENEDINFTLRYKSLSFYKRLFDTIKCDHIYDLSTLRKEYKTLVRDDVHNRILNGKESNKDTHICVNTIIALEKETKSELETYINNYLWF